VGLYGNLLAFLFGPLPHNTVVVWRAGGFELERYFLALVVEPMQGLLVVSRRYFLVFEILSPSGGH
jgi:hypothetical protein